MTYTMRDLMERAKHEANGLYEWFEIDEHTISIMNIWSCSGGRNRNLVSVSVDGKTIATRCRKDTALRKALSAISE